MHRTTDSVARQIRKLEAERNGGSSQAAALTPALSPDKELSVSERAILVNRLDRILGGLMAAEMTEAWSHTLRETPREIWINDILALISTPVGRILAAPSPPSISFGWETTSNVGVYAWILRRKHCNPFFPEHYVYIGSATKFDWGLSGRKFQHQQGKDGSSFTLRHRIRQQGLTKRGHFVALLSKQLDAYEPNEIVEKRRLLVLAEAVLTIWLGALSRGKPELYEGRRSLRSLGPWNVEDMPYQGICSHNPLSKDIAYPSDYEAGTP